MHVLIAPDSFKESLAAPDVAWVIKNGFSKVFPEASYDLMPLGDGGEGTLDSLVHSLGLNRQSTQVTGPFGENIQVQYAVKGSLAMFEMAELVGLASIPIESRAPLQIQTRGLGELIVHLVEAGMERIMIGVGGSASHDGGMGMAAGLGFQFFDKNGQELEPIGANLGKVVSYSKPDTGFDSAAIQIDLITDVTNPLCGQNGATYVFAAQKGLAPERFAQVDQEMHDFYQLVNPDLIEKEGAGAGGGMAAGLCTFAGATIHSGIDFVLDQLDFEKRASQANLVIVGEGRLDRQSLSGKTPIGVARRVKQGVPVVAICGSLADDLPDFPFENICAAFPIISKLASLEESLALAEVNLERTAEQIARILKISQAWKDGL
ncbi:glycerate kinase [Streptococcus suis]|uniref:glycerate kinase n=1 Tax=Streptococcus sp. ZY1909104 TaxID=3233335 RepID=UPI00143245D6|nr:glycerate kinase [Streptococcus suis]